MKTTDQSEPPVCQKHNGFVGLLPGGRARRPARCAALLPIRLQENLAFTRPRTLHGIPVTFASSIRTRSLIRFDPDPTKRMQQHFQADRSAGA